MAARPLVASHLKNTNYEELIPEVVIAKQNS